MFPGKLILILDCTALAAAPAAIADGTLSIETLLQLRRRGVEARIVTGLQRRSVDRGSAGPSRAFLAWMDQVRAGTPIAAIAQTEGVSERFIGARLPLALLSPQIVTAMEAGPAAGDHRAPGAHGPAIGLGRASTHARL